MKIPKCKNCEDGMVHIDIPQGCDKVFDIPCWVCGGMAFKGMTPEQIKWYQAQYALLADLRGKILRAGEVVNSVAYQTLKNAINKACGRLGVTFEKIEEPTATHYKETTVGLRLALELNEYKRRLTAIPVVLARKA